MGLVFEALATVFEIAKDDYGHVVAKASSREKDRDEIIAVLQTQDAGDDSYERKVLQEIARRFHAQILPAQEKALPVSLRASCGGIEIALDPR
jgi:hypothetical protein